jgi:hypothetical protein
MRSEHQEGKLRRRDRRRIRLERHRRIQREACPYILDPAQTYLLESDTVLRAIARWIEKRGWAPTQQALVQKKLWRDTATRNYLLDLQAAGLVEQNESRGWSLTSKGWYAIKYDPIAIRYPTDSRARQEIRWAERRKGAA